MNRDELKGKVRIVKGRFKQAAADVTNDPDLHDEGVVDQAAGNAQAVVGQARRKSDEAIKHIGNAIKK